MLICICCFILPLESCARQSRILCQKLGVLQSRLTRMKLTTQTLWHKRLAYVSYTLQWRHQFYKAVVILKSEDVTNYCSALLETMGCFVRNNGQHGSLMVSVLVSANKRSFSQISLSRYVLTYRMLRQM